MPRELSITWRVLAAVLGLTCIVGAPGCSCGFGSGKRQCSLLSNGCTHLVVLPDLLVPFAEDFHAF